MKEMLKGIEFDSLPEEIQKNLTAFLEKINLLREAANFPWIVTSGYRSLEQHEEIYRQINDRRIAAGEKPVWIPMSSQHLYGRAVDIFDPSRKLQHWVLDHLELLEDNGIYCESFDSTPTWVHFQDVPPKSGNRFFIP